MVRERDPILFFRDVLRAGDYSYVELLVRLLRSDPALRERADRELAAAARPPPGADPEGRAHLSELVDALKDSQQRS